MRNVIDNFAFGNRYDWSDPFTIVIDTRNTIVGGSDVNSFFLPQSPDIQNSSISFLVDWGDGQFSRINSRTEAEIPHVYQTPGIYIVNFYKRRGNFELRPNYRITPNERNKLLKILRWGSFNNTNSCFRYCINLDLSEVEDKFIGIGEAEYNFANTSVIKFKNLSNIIFTGGKVERIFQSCIYFNDDFTLNVTNATNILAILEGCVSFNKTVIINAPQVTSLAGFFRGCTNFNKPVHYIGVDWTKIESLNNFMTGKTSANYNAIYYDNLLIALDNAGRSDVPLGMGSIKHTSEGLAAKNNLIAKGWTITDGGII
jgi:hypothetical protein